MSLHKDSKVKINETLCLPNNIESHGYVYENPFQKIERITAQFDGFVKEYFVSDYGPKVALLAMQGNCVLLARQYRLLINRLSYEVPGGKVDNGESCEEASIRECLEETGIKCLNLKPLIDYDPDLEYIRNHVSVFYSDQIEGNPRPENENAEWVHIYECLKMIERGVITDSLSIIAIMAYQLRIGTSG